MNTDVLTRVTDKILSLSKVNDVTLVAISGGSCSGKGFISDLIVKVVDGKIFPIDDYYKGIRLVTNENFDEPSALDLISARHHLTILKNTNPVIKPMYDFAAQECYDYEVFTPAKIIIVDGLFAMHFLLRGLMDVKIFVDADRETRLRRRLERDPAERGRTIASVHKQFKESTQPMHELHIEPQKENADYIIENNYIE